MLKCTRKAEGFPHGVRQNRSFTSPDRDFENQDVGSKTSDRLDRGRFNSRHLHFVLRLTSRGRHIRPQIFYLHGNDGATDYGWVVLYLLKKEMRKNLGISDCGFRKGGGGTDFVQKRRNWKRLNPKFELAIRNSYLGCCIDFERIVIP